MEPCRIVAELRTRQLNAEGDFIWKNDPDELMLDVIANQLEEKPDATNVLVRCPSRYSDPSDYSYSWYLKYSHLTFEFVGPYAAQFEQAAKAARARQGGWQ